MPTSATYVSKPAALQGFRASVGHEAFDATNAFQTGLAASTLKGADLRHLATEA